MIGFKRKKAEQPSNQIPYEVYETLRQPSVRRRMFAVRLIAALVVVTLLVFGALALSRKVLNVDDNEAPGNNQPASGSDGQGQEPGNQTPAPTPTPETEANPPQPSQPDDSGRNTDTVRKPE